MIISAGRVTVEAKNPVMQGPEVRPAPRELRTLRGKFFVTASVLRGKDEMHLYLHRDGSWHLSTHNRASRKDGGYFASERSAKRTLAKARLRA
jgi:hypothetical protein